VLDYLLTVKAFLEVTMGGTLSQPVTEKHSVDGKFGRKHYGVSEMQGWRQTMEDAYIALPEVTPEVRHCGMFAVFDGHGGDEVSKFCAKHIPEELAKLPSFQDQRYGDALKEVVFLMDDMLLDPKYEHELAQYQEDLVTEQYRLHSGDNGDPKMQALLEAFEDSEAKLLVEEENENGVEPEKDSDQIDASKEEAENDDNSKKSEPSNRVKESDEGPVQNSKVIRIINVKTVTSGEVIEKQDTASTEAEIVPGVKTMEDGSKHVVVQTVLPDNEQEHPEMEFPTNAGCTSVIALIVKNMVYVANTGDSRAIVARKALAYPLSIDHKPTLSAERNRIYKAGGYVNVQGRICDDLNLSRSIGDLRFKVDTTIGPEAQIITALPDIKEYALKQEDQFIVVACDGVWDVMSNQEVVDFVLRELKNGEKKVSAIVERLLDKCISPNLFQTNGLGGDNMTCIIVLLKAPEELQKARIAGTLKKTVNRVNRLLR